MKSIRIFVWLCGPNYELPSLQAGTAVLLLASLRFQFGVNDDYREKFIFLSRSKFYQAGETSQ
jgi:hypothetical protein